MGVLHQIRKDHRGIAANLIARPKYGGGWYDTRTHWHPTTDLKLEVLAEADAKLEQAADALGRAPGTLAHRARDKGITLPEEWSRFIRPKYVSKRKKIESPLNYPYIQKARPEHADLMFVNSLVPAGISDSMRADICQEIMVALLEGRTTVEILKSRDKSAAYFIRRFYKDNFEDGGHALSFNASDDDADTGILRSLEIEEQRRNQFQDDFGMTDSYRRSVPPTQFHAAWLDQVGRYRLQQSELGEFLTHEEAEELLEAA